MSTGTPTRTCGSCDAPVDASAVTCPRCGALLAAYEAPRGSEEGTTGIPPTVASTPVTSTPTGEALRNPSRQHEPVWVAPPEARVDPGPVPKPAAQKIVTPARTASPDPTQGGQKAPSAAPRLEPRQRSGPKPVSVPAREAPMQQRAAPTRQRSTREIASIAASFGKLALGVLMILVFLGILDFNLIPILVLGVVMLSLLGVMRSAAKASGRKTTTMHDPRRRDTWRR